MLVVQGTRLQLAAAPITSGSVFLPNADDLTDAIGRIARFLDRYPQASS